MAPVDSQDISIDIACPFGRANGFLSVPANFGRWASGLGDSFTSDGDAWLVETPTGPARVSCTPRNAFGVLDHRIVPPGGGAIEVPMRVVPNGSEGCHVTLTLFRAPTMSAEQFAADAEWVRRDLARLKLVLEDEVASRAESAPQRSQTIGGGE